MPADRSAGAPISSPLKLSAHGLQAVALEPAREFDVVIVGAGAGGLTAALAAAHAGLEALVIEKALTFGGTSAMSGGALWVPCSELAKRAGIADSPQEVKAYLASCAPAALDSERLDAFLEQAPRMLDFVARNTPVRFVLGRHVSDYHPDSPHARDVGRCVVAASLDARGIGNVLSRLAPPLQTTTFGGLPLEQARAVIQMFDHHRSWASMRRAFRLAYRALIDRARFGRSARLGGGQALMTGLMQSALDSNVEVWLSAPAARLVPDSSGAVTGVEVDTPHSTVRIGARHGVVLATGGFAHDAALRGSLYDHVRAGSAHVSVAGDRASGDGIRIAREVGAKLEAAPHGAAAWIPVSQLPQADGSLGYPHFADRAKPGVIAVGPNARRFVNEASSYHAFVRGMFEACQGRADVSAWLIADHRAIKRYGLGFAKPWPWRRANNVRSGYLLRADSVHVLAQKMGVDPAVLHDEVARFNTEARRGHDPQFGKGSTIYNRKMGDSLVRPNPCLAPLETAPFYAVRLIPGDLGTFTGLRTDAHARVLRADGTAIDGLYAVGADMTNPLAGGYPGAGSTLGPIMTSGYIAANHIAHAAGAKPTATG